jgi:hypothetical protein
MISPLKIWSFAAAKPGASNIHAVILIISFFIFFSLGLDYSGNSLGACRAKASSTSPTSCAKPAFLCGLSAVLCDLLIEFADRLVITRLGIQWRRDYG